MIWVITSVPEELDEDLRNIMNKKNKGIHKGDLRNAIMEAAREWIDKQSTLLGVSTHANS